MLEELWSILLRTTSAFLIIMVIARILGKQTISQMTYHDFVAAITLGAITANLAFNTKLNLWSLLAALLLFSAIAYLFSWISLKFRKSRKWLSGKPTMVIENGKILEQNLRKMRFNLDTLNQELREKDIFNVEEVEYAVLELNGKMSVLKKPAFRTAQKRDLTQAGSQPADAQTLFPVELIMDGQFIGHPTQQQHTDEAWLRQELEKRKVSVSDICYAVKGTNGKLFIDYYDDRLSHPLDPE